MLVECFTPGLPGIIFTVLSPKGRAEQKYPACCQHTHPCSRQEIENSGFSGKAYFQVKMTPLTLHVLQFFRSKCEFEGNFASHPHHHPVQFNTMLVRDLNLVILKNEISVTLGELVECRYSKGNSRLYERPSLVRRNPLLNTGQCAACHAHLRADSGCSVPGPAALTSRAASRPEALSQASRPSPAG